MKTRKPLRSRAAKAWTRSPVTPLSAMKREVPVVVVTECEPGPVQEKLLTPRSEEYLAWVRTQPCCWHRGNDKLCVNLAVALGIPRRFWGIQASHHPAKMGGSKGLKSSDFRTLPLCVGAHKIFTDKQRFRQHKGDARYPVIEEEIGRHVARWHEQQGAL